MQQKPLMFRHNGDKKMKLFGIDFGCGKESGICKGVPCPLTHDQNCCMRCPKFPKCPDSCPNALLHKRIITKEQFKKFPTDDSYDWNRNIQPLPPPNKTDLKLPSPFLHPSRQNHNRRLPTKIIPQRHLNLPSTQHNLLQKNFQSHQHHRQPNNNNLKPYIPQPS